LENDILLYNADVGVDEAGDMVLPIEPAEFEDHLVHYRTHLMAMREASYKDLPQEIRDRFELHVEATELLMEKRAIQSKAFLAALIEIPEYPMFHTPTLLISRGIYPDIEAAPLAEPLPEEVSDPLAEEDLISQ